MKSIRKKSSAKKYKTFSEKSKEPSRQLRYPITGDQCKQVQALAKTYEIVSILFHFKSDHPFRINLLSQLRSGTISGIHKMILKAFCEFKCSKENPYEIYYYMRLVNLVFNKNFIPIYDEKSKDVTQWHPRLTQDILNLQQDMTRHSRKYPVALNLINWNSLSILLNDKKKLQVKQQTLKTLTDTFKAELLKIEKKRKLLFEIPKNTQELAEKLNQQISATHSEVQLTEQCVLRYIGCAKQEIASNSLEVFASLLSFAACNSPRVSEALLDMGLFAIKTLSVKQLAYYWLADVLGQMTTHGVQLNQASILRVLSHLLQQLPKANEKIQPDMLYYYDQNKTEIMAHFDAMQAVLWAGLSCGIETIYTDLQKDMAERFAYFGERAKKAVKEENNFLEERAEALEKLASNFKNDKTRMERLKPFLMPIVGLGSGVGGLTGSIIKLVGTEGADVQAYKDALFALYEIAKSLWEIGELVYDIIPATLPDWYQSFQCAQQLIYTAIQMNDPWVWQMTASQLATKNSQERYTEKTLVRVIDLLTRTLCQNKDLYDCLFPVIISYDEQYTYHGEAVIKRACAAEYVIEEWIHGNKELTPENSLQKVILDGRLQLKDNDEISNALVRIFGYGSNPLSVRKLYQHAIFDDIEKQRQQLTEFIYSILSYAEWAKQLNQPHTLVTDLLKKVFDEITPLISIIHQVKAINESEIVCVSTKNDEANLPASFITPDVLVQDQDSRSKVMDSRAALSNFLISKTKKVLLIDGEPLSGKEVLARYIMTCCEQQRYIPIVIALEDLTEDKINYFEKILQSPYGLSIERTHVLMTRTGEKNQERIDTQVSLLFIIQRVDRLISYTALKNLYGQLGMKKWERRAKFVFVARSIYITELMKRHQWELLFTGQRKYEAGQVKLQRWTTINFAPPQEEIEEEMEEEEEEIEGKTKKEKKSLTSPFWNATAVEYLLGLIQVHDFSEIKDKKIEDKKIKIVEYQQRYKKNIMKIFDAVTLLRTKQNSRTLWTWGELKCLGEAVIKDIIVKKMLTKKLLNENNIQDYFKAIEDFYSNHEKIYLPHASYLVKGTDNSTKEGKKPMKNEPNPQQGQPGQSTAISTNFRGNLYIREVQAGKKSAAFLPKISGKSTGNEQGQALVTKYLDEIDQLNSQKTRELLEAANKNVDDDDAFRKIEKKYQLLISSKMKSIEEISTFIQQGPDTVENNIKKKIEKYVAERDQLVIGKTEKEIVEIDKKYFLLIEGNSKTLELINKANSGALQPILEKLHALNPGQTVWSEHIDISAALGIGKVTDAEEKEPVTPNMSTGT